MIELKDFKEQYSYACKKYPDIKKDIFLSFDKNIGTCTTTKYELQNKEWVQVSSITENITGEFYANTVDAIPFFENLGGVEDVETARTRYGVLPVKIASISPMGDQKIIRSFYFQSSVDKTCVF